LRNVIYGCCLTETFNAARMVDWLQTTTDPYLHDVTKQLLADEAQHGQFGFHYLELMQPWLDEHPDSRTSIAAYMRLAFAVFERDYAGRMRQQQPLSDDERALGMPDYERHLQVFDSTLQSAIIPGLERLGIAARQAWVERGVVKSPSPPADSI